MVNDQFKQNLPSGIFAYHLHKPLMNWFFCVNGKQLCLFVFSLELVLVKQVHEHHWSSVVKGDDRGMYELVGEEAERVKEIHNRLEHLTSDKVVSKKVVCNFLSEK